MSIKCFTSLWLPFLTIYLSILSNSFLALSPPFFLTPETRDAPTATTHTHKQLCKLTPHFSYHPISVTQELPQRSQLTHAYVHKLLLVCWCEKRRFSLRACIKRVARSHRLSRSSISLSGCAELRLRWGRWGQPCPPLYWSVGGSSAAPPPWTESPASGCLSAPPPPHRRAPLEYWPTISREKKRLNKGKMKNDGWEPE